MPEAVATIRIVGKDQASREVQKVDRAVKDLQGTSKKAESSLQGVLRPVASRLGPAAVAGGLLIVAKNSLQAASNLEELTSKAKFVFGESFPRITEEAGRVAKEVGRADSQILQMAADYGAIIQPMGIATDTAGDMSVQLAQLAVDMSSFHNATEIEAFNALRSAITGETEPMKRFGVVMTQANLAAFALKKGIKDKIEAMNQAQMTALRYNFILESTKQAQGDAARTAGSVANQFRRVKGTTRELFEELGKPLLPATAEALEFVNEGLEGGIVLLKGLTTGAEVSFGRLRDVFVTISHLAGFENVGLKDYRGAALQGLDKDLSLEDVNMSIGKTKDVTSEADEELQTLIDSLAGVGGSLTGASKKASQDTGKLKEAMEELGEEYGERRSQIIRELKELEFNHEQSMDSIKEQIQGVERSLADLERSYRKTKDALRGDEVDSVADQIEKVEELQKRIDDLNDQARQEDRKGSVSAKTNERIAELKRQMEQERTALESFLSESPDGSQIERSAREELKKTGFEKEIENIRERRVEEEDAFTNRKAELELELGKLEEKKLIEQEAYTLQRQELELTQLAVDAFAADYETAMGDIDSVTEETVKSMKKHLMELQSTISQIDALITANAAVTGGDTIESRVRDRRGARVQEFASGGVVNSPTLGLFGEAGPEAFVPLPDGRTIPVTVQGKSGTTVNGPLIGEVHIHNEADEDRFVQKVARLIQLESLASS